MGIFRFGEATAAGRGELGEKVQIINMINIGTLRQRGAGFGRSA
jgi:hypothetical protein